MKEIAAEHPGTRPTEAAGRALILLGAFVSFVLSDAAGISSAPTVQGSQLPISIDGGVHVIDRVLLPAAA